MDQQSHGNPPFGGAPQPQTPPPVPAPVPVPAAEAPRGGIAEGIFAEVERMTAGGTMTRSDAFERISDRTGRRAGTVAANYYRIARKRGTVATRAKRGPGQPAGSHSTGSTAVILARLESAVKDLGDLLRAQDAEINKLREQSAQFDKLREWMSKNS